MAKNPGKQNWVGGHPEGIYPRGDLERLSRDLCRVFVPL